jgi:hypothetical protein
MVQLGWKLGISRKEIEEHEELTDPSDQAIKIPAPEDELFSNTEVPERSRSCRQETKDCHNERISRTDVRPSQSVEALGKNHGRPLSRQPPTSVPVRTSWM